MKVPKGTFMLNIYNGKMTSRLSGGWDLEKVKRAISSETRTAFPDLQLNEMIGMLNMMEHGSGIL